MEYLLTIKRILYCVIGFIFLSSLQSCEVEFFDDNEVTSGTGVIIGLVTDQQNNALPDVVVSVNDKLVHSESNGTFLLSDVPVGKKTTITFKLNGYATNQKVAEILTNDTTYVKAALGAWAISADYSSDQNNTVIFQNASVKLDANSLVDENGQAVNGNITVSATYFDPTDSTYADVFPGDFIGEDINGNEVAIESFGFITVEITQGDKELDLAQGEESEIIIPLPGSIANNAPDTIPLWYFNEEMGTWIEEGSATLQNGTYVGKVTHFSSWNADKPFEGAFIRGIVRCEDGRLLEDVTVVANGVDYFANTKGKTLTDGSYELSVKADAIVDVYAYTVTPFGTIDLLSQTIRTLTPGFDLTKTIDDLLIFCDTTHTDTTGTGGNYSRLYDLTTDFPNDWEGGRVVAVGESGWIVSYNFKDDIWEREASGTVQAFYGIDFPAWKKMWAVGSNGTVKLSEDMGKSWTQIPIGTDADLLDVEFYNAYYGWIVGTTGKIYNTTDAGQTWNIQVSGTVQTLHDAAFVSKNEGWVCGTSNGTFGTILHTIDGGVTWENQISNTFENLRGIEFIDKFKGWAIGENGVIVKTEDGGQTWAKETSINLFEDLNGIDFANFNYGVIVGINGTYLKTTDGGISWEISNPSNSTNAMEAVDFRSGRGSGYVVGDDNTFEIWGFGGSARTNGWVEQNSNTTEELNDVKSVSESVAWAVGDNGAVLFTNDSGNNWQNVGFINTENLFSVEVIGNNVWIGGESNTLFKSNDSGLSWTAQSVLTPGIKIKKIQFVDSMHGWYLTGDYDNSPTDSESLYKTDDGGLNWIKVSGVSGVDDMVFIDQNTGWTVRSEYNCEISETSNGGQSWGKINYSSETNSSAASICILNDKYLWISTGENLYHQELGKNWYVKYVDFSSIFDQRLIDLEFTDEQNGWGIYELESALYKTNNGGKTWYYQNSIFNDMVGVNSLDMTNNLVGWVVGRDGKIYYTNSGGE